jgi:quercetin dioxygenase-like cupin family protein
MDVHAAGDVTSVLGGEHFAGRVWLDLLLERGGDGGLRLYRVFFDPGARTHWHMHPGGQSLLILSGTARTGAEGGPARTAGQGDVVSTAPGEWHWHGAGPNGPMVHLAFNPGGKPQWGDDREVTAAEYEA